MVRDDSAANIESGCWANGPTSLVASTLGSFIGAIGFVGWMIATYPFTEEPSVENAIFIGMIVLMVGGIVAIPVGLVFGLPLLANYGPVILRHRFGMSLVFGLVGLAGGYVIGSMMGNASAGMIFGTTIGALHSLLYRAEGNGR